MAGPGDGTAAGAGGHRNLRASHADRERVIDELKAAFVLGRLDRDEFGVRVSRALESPTCAELAALTADLPPRLVTVPRPVKAIRARKAIAQCERVLADREAVEGADHPDTIAARANLAYAYRIAKRFRDAIPQYERTLDDRIRVQGPDHPDTLTTRSNLAACYQQACRLAEAIPQYKRALADSERTLGAGDTATLITRCNLASAYYTAGRLTEVVVVLRRALTDCERYLGADHEMTQTVRANLDAAIQI
jgi:tetratricopeptide (TPR) repeat protein